MTDQVPANEQHSILSTNEADVNIIVSYRLSKTSIPLTPGTTVQYVKSTLAQTVNTNDESIQIKSDDIKLLHKGKVLSDDTIDLHQMFRSCSNGKKRDIKLMATGISKTEVQNTQREHKEILANAPRIRDDLTDSGKRELARRKRLGRSIMNKVAAGATDHTAPSQKYKFHRIETLPMLPDQNKAKEILTTLANDPGVLSCMAKHGWSVGCLAELYPEGKVGESAVCVMGLNQNRGQKLLLRIRTDDLRGFRKMLSIRKVLFHELAHNVHDEHDENFFQLMRQIEREYNELNWTNSSGKSTGGSFQGEYNKDEEYDVDIDRLYVSGSGRLGGTQDRNGLSLRELAARAATQRMTAEEEEIEEACGCGQNKKTSIKTVSQTTSTLLDMNMGDIDEKKNRS